MPRNKKGLSPVIATILLVLLAVVIAVLIFLWIKSFIGEELQKTVGTEPEPIAKFCDELGFRADAYQSGNDLNVTIQNLRDVPIYGVEVKKRGFAFVKNIGTALSAFGAVKSGDTEENMIVSNAGISANDQVILIPMLLGKKGEETKSYTCDEKYGIEAAVQ